MNIHGVSNDAKHMAGTVVVWWASTGLIMMKAKAHEGPVRQLQFDATKVTTMIFRRTVNQRAIGLAVPRANRGSHNSEENQERVILGNDWN